MSFTYFYYLIDLNEISILLNGSHYYICPSTVMFSKCLVLIREYKLNKVMGFIVVSQEDPRLFLKPWCLKKGHCSLSTTRDMLSKSSNSLESRTLQEVGTSSWELSSSWQQELCLSVSGLLCPQSSALEIFCVPFIQHCLISFLLTLLLCIIVFYWLCPIIFFSLIIVYKIL